MSFVSEKSASPATPQGQTHGINKSFLTPCRRVGLKRKSPNTFQMSPADCDINGKRRNDDVIQEELLSNTNSGSPENLNEVACKIGLISAETPKRGNCLLGCSSVTKERGPKRKQRRNQADVTDTESTPHRETVELIVNINNSQHTGAEAAECYDQTTLETLQKRVAEKEEKVQALKIAHVYKKKHDMSELKETIKRWKEGCQCALQDLLEITKQQEHKDLTMVQLLAHLGIPPDLIGYDPEQEEFY